MEPCFLRDKNANRSGVGYDITFDQIMACSLAEKPFQSKELPIGVENATLGNLIPIVVYCEVVFDSPRVVLVRVCCY